MIHPDYPNHPVRPAAEQSVHDRVIETLAQHLQQEGFKDVRTNPGRQKNNAVLCNKQKRIWPDVFTVENKKVTRIYEVETISTVDTGSAEQWEDYARCVPRFYLVVPESKQKEAERILQARGIPYKRIYTYKG